MVLARLDLVDNEGDLILMLFAHRGDGTLLPPGLWRAVAEDDHGVLREAVVDVATLDPAIQEMIVHGNAAMRKRCG